MSRKKKVKKHFQSHLIFVKLLLGKPIRIDKMIITYKNY